MVFGIKVIAFGLGAVLAAGGIGLIALGYYQTPNNQSAISSGWLLIAIAVFMWIAGFVSKESRRGGLFH